MKQIKLFPKGQVFVDDLFYGTWKGDLSGYWMDPTNSFYPFKSFPDGIEITPVVSIAKIAMLFSYELRRALDECELKIVVFENEREKNPAICHSHDFCDANMLMHSAFVAVVGHEPDLMNDDLNIWNAAWDLAKKNKFII